MEICATDGEHTENNCQENKLSLKQARQLQNVFQFCILTQIALSDDVTRCVVCFRVPQIKGSSFNLF